MKLIYKIFISLILFGLGGGVIASPWPVFAQTVTPPKEDTSPNTTMVIKGRVVNKTQSTPVAGPLEVMLHMYDGMGADKGMLHAKAQANGQFTVNEAPTGPGWQYMGVVNYLGIPYSSAPVTAVEAAAGTEIEIPVYEVSSDLTNVLVDRMQILFEFAEDGINVSEFYLLSNLGKTTVKGSQALEGNKQASYSFPLPSEAQYPLFQPDGSTRFVKQPNGFADTAPLLPGEESTHAMVSYLLPYREPRTFTYLNPFKTRTLELAVPAKYKVSINGDGLTKPEAITTQNGSVYLVYKVQDIDANHPYTITLDGQPAGVVIQAASPTPTSHPIPLPVIYPIAAVALGLISIGGWIWIRNRWAVTRMVGGEMGLSSSSPIGETAKSKRNPSLSVWLIVSGLGLLLIAIWALRGNNPKANPPNAGSQAQQLEVDQKILDYGDQKLGSTVKATVRVTNTGGKMLRFTEAPYIEIKEGC